MRQGGPGRRRLVVALAVLVLTVVLLVIGAGWWVRVRVQDSLALHVEKRLPGTTAHVEVASFPILIHLAASGTILALSVHLSRVSAGPLVFNGIHLKPINFDDVDIRTNDLVVTRGQLLHRRLVLDRIRRATITATVKEASLDRSIGLPLTLGHGTVGLGGLVLPATITTQGRQITISVPDQISVSLDAPPLAALPCLGAVVIVPGALQLSCTLDHLPPALPTTTLNL